MDELTDRRQADSHSQSHLALILTIAAILVASNLYFLWETHQIQQQVSQIESSRQSDLATIQDNAKTSANAMAKTFDELRARIDDGRGQALQAANQATKNARRHVDDMAQKLESEQHEAQEHVASAIDEVKEAATTANAKVAEVADHVTTVDTQVSQTRSDVERTAAELKRVQGDLGVQSGLIATNAKELSALKELGDRNYLEFDVKKTGRPQRIGTINVVLRKTDPKRNRYTLDVIADDKRVEKKDRYINEPVQFYVSRARQPYELVVNEVQKERVVGYLSTPKVLSASR